MNKLGTVRRWRLKRTRKEDAVMTSPQGSGAWLHTLHMWGRGCDVMLVSLVVLSSTDWLEKEVGPCPFEFEHTDRVREEKKRRRKSRAGPVLK